MEIENFLNIKRKGGNFYLDVKTEGWSRNQKKLKTDNVLLHSRKIKGKDREIYRVYHLSELDKFKDISKESGINCDVTVMRKGIFDEGDGIGEMFLTYGHIHTEKRNEIYKVIKGEIFLIMVDEESKKEIIVNMKEGDEYLINFKYLHRIYTYDSAVVLGFVPKDAGHNYDVIKNKGFPYHLFYDKNNDEILIKKNWRFGNFDIVFSNPQNIDSENLFFKNTKKMMEILGIKI